MKNVTLRQLQKVTMGRLFHAAGVMDVEISAIVSDSRKVRDDCLFICIKGAKADGHDFAQTVIENGALAVVSEKELPGFEGPYLLVDSTFEATKAIAQYYREQLDVVFIGVTGSVGKTSTKEFIAEVLSRRYRVHKTQGNLNNEWGVPFTIFRIKEGTDVAVIEMGINHFGEMDRLAKMVQPDIVVMTNIGQSHLEFLGSRDGILKAKAEVFHYLSDDGKVVPSAGDTEDGIAVVRVLIDDRLGGGLQLFPVIVREPGFVRHGCPPLAVAATRRGAPWHTPTPTCRISGCGKPHPCQNELRSVFTAAPLRRWSADR